MKRRSSSRCVLVLCILSLPLTPSRAQTDTLIVPREAETAIGSTFADPFFFSQGVVQQVYGATEFAGSPTDVITLTGLAFRLNDHPSGEPLDAVIPRITMEMGVFRGPIEEITTNIHENLSDPAVVFDMEAVPLKAAGNPSPNQFEVTFAFQRPFTYDRKLGQLVLNIWSCCGLGQVGGMDAHGAPNRGAFILLEPGGTYRKREILMATKFFYTLFGAMITSIRVQTNSVQIDFSIFGTPISVDVEGSTTVIGGYSEENAEIAMVSPGKWRATVPIAPLLQKQRFFRIKLQ